MSRLIAKLVNGEWKTFEDYPATMDRERMHSRIAYEDHCTRAGSYAFATYCYIVLTLDERRK